MVLHSKSPPGFNVWDHEWVEVMRDPLPEPSGDEFADLKSQYEIALVKDPLYGQAYEFGVYEIMEDTGKH